MKTISNKSESIFLFAGDIVLWFTALFLTLAVRHTSIPTSEMIKDHIVPFSILFIAWAVVFFVAGLYEPHTVLFKSRLQSLIFKTEIAMIVVAVSFFYFIPYFGITPKTILFIYLVISFFLMLIWRSYGHSILSTKQKQNAIIIGSGPELKELRDEVNNNSRYSIRFISSVHADAVSSLDFQSEIVERVYSEDVNLITIDLRDDNIAPLIPNLYNLMFSHVRFVDMHKLYEDIFNRVPLSLVRYNWFLENISATRRFAYDLIKRLMDIFISLPLLFVPVLTFPFAFVLGKFEDGGPVFIYQERIGKNNRKIKIVKFRTMLFDDRGQDVEKNRITRLGSFLRKTRLDEFPQLWNVLKGDISLIGPRPELPSLVERYNIDVPFYNVRHLIKPGLSGWAQIYHDNHPHHKENVEETKHKLSYDLYYIKNRSIWLDFKIALLTIRILLSRSGI